MELPTATNQKGVQSKEDTASNPFENDQDFCRLVFQHLTGLDLLNLSETSRSFYQLVAKNEDKRLQLMIDENWSREFEADHVANTGRKYTSVNVKQLLRRRDQVLPLFSKFSEHLVSIDTGFDFEMNGIVLPLVKSVNIKMEHGVYFERGLLSSVSNLEKLQISGPVTFPEKVVECLKSNPGLKELILEDTSAEAVFGNAINPVEMQLKVLKINKANLESQAESNLIAFLKSQEGSIVELKLLICNFHVLAEVFKGMKNLRRFTYSPLNNYYLPLYKHPNIEEMNLILLSELQLQNMLEKTPNLKKLYIAAPTQETIVWLMHQSIDLRQFRFAFIQGTDITVDQLRAWYVRQKLNNNSRFNNHLEVIAQL